MKTVEEKKAYKREQAKKYRLSETGRSYRQTERYKDIVRLGQKKYYGSEKDLARRNRYRRTGNYKRRKSVWETTWNRNIRLKLISLLGGRCVECGVDDVRILDIHHTFNDGREERLKFGYETAIWKFYIKNVDLAKERLQILCKNHHFLTRYNGGKYSQ